jgi:hypothetical protein
VKSWTDNEYAKRLDTWGSQGKEGPAPTRKAVQSALLHEVSPRPGDEAASAKDKVDAYRILRCSTVYPSVACLCDDGRLSITDLLVKELSKHRKAISKSVFRGDPRNQIIERFQETKLWNHRAELKRSSTKYLKLVEQIDALEKSAKEPSDGRPNERNDSFNKRHMLVFTDSPFAAFTTFMFLHEHYDEKHNLDIQ